MDEVVLPPHLHAFLEILGEVAAGHRLRVQLLVPIALLRDDGLVGDGLQFQFRQIGHGRRSSRGLQLMGNLPKTGTHVEHLAMFLRFFIHVDARAGLDGKSVK